MMKSCVVLDGVIINVGEWDYQIQPVKVGEREVEPAEYDEDENLIKEAVMEPIYEDQATNPLPEGAIIEERDFEYDEDRGWYEVGLPNIPTAQERLEALEEALLLLMMEG